MLHLDLATLLPTVLWTLLSCIGGSYLARAAIRYLSEESVSEPATPSVPEEKEAATPTDPSPAAEEGKPAEPTAEEETKDKPAEPVPAPKKRKVKAKPVGKVVRDVAILVGGVIVATALFAYVGVLWFGL